MTRKEIKEVLPILQAFAEGRVIQYRDNGVWKDITTEDGFYAENAFVNVNDYRIKPSPTYRPFVNADECWQEMQKHQPFGWVKTKNGIYTNILIVNSDEANVVTGLSDMCCSFNDMFQKYVFIDNAPFGIKVMEE